MTMDEAGPAKPRTRRFVVAKVEDVPVGGHLVVEVSGREIGLFNIDGEFFALLNRCPHRAGPLCEGEVIRLVVAAKVGEIRLDDRTMVVCPWHAWEFDIRTGQSYFDPAKMRGRPFPVEVESAAEVGRELAAQSVQLVPGPYVADVIATTVEDDYVVVTMR
jgi:nitrite reductase/ring-hydroxylating ferredoxin subunit